MSGKILLTGGHVVTLDDVLGDFPVGAVLIEDGTIVAVGQAADISAPDAEVIDATDTVVIPGMVDTHRHASMSLTRGLGLDQDLIHFLSNTYLRWFPATSVEDMKLSALVGALEALDSGVTTIMDTCEAFHTPEHAEAELQGLKESGIRSFYCFGMGQDRYGDHAAGTPGWEARFAHVKRLLAENSDKDALTQIALQTSIVGSVPWHNTAAELKWAKQEGLLSCTHSCGMMNSEATKDILQRADHDLLIPGHVYIHCTNLTAQELDLIAESKGKLSLAMESDMQMGMGVPPLRRSIERGINPSLSIDTATAIAPDLLSQMRIALQTQRMLDHCEQQRSGAVSMKCEYGVRDALVWGTRNGAEAVGLGHRIGTLSPGKRADVVTISNKRFLSPSAYPLGTAIMHSNGADIDTVIVDGHIRKRDGKLVGHDLDEIRSQAKAGLGRIMENLKGMRPEMNFEERKEYFKVVERVYRDNVLRSYKDGATALTGWVTPA